MFSKTKHEIISWKSFETIFCKKIHTSLELIISLGIERNSTVGLWPYVLQKLLA